MLQGDFNPNFTARMMLKDIELTLDLTERHGVKTPMTELIKRRYEDAIERYGESCGSAAPARLAEDESDCSFSTGAGNAKDAFENWSYTTEFVNGSYNIVHQDYENAYLKEPFTTHHPVQSEVEVLRKMVQELEEQLAAAKK